MSWRRCSGCVLSLCCLVGWVRLVVQRRTTGVLIHGALWVLRSGMRWQDMPSHHQLFKSHNPLRRTEHSEYAQGQMTRRAFLVTYRLRTRKQQSMSASACSHHLRSDLPLMASRVVGEVTARDSFTRIEDRVFRLYNGSRMAKRSAWQMKTRRKSPNVRSPSKADVRESPSGESANVTNGTLGILSGPICKSCSGMVAYGCCAPSKPPPSNEVLRNNPSGRYR